MASPGAEAARDPGLQPERTKLAWRRTTLSATVAAVLAARQCAADGPGDPAGLLGAALTLLVWAAFLAVAHRRMRALAAHRPPALSPRAAAAAALCTVALACCAIALVA
ncbi:DUF202 domain-containing protein [Streptomyces sp. ODS05-4]|uniref:DUF202 domain-containing protein n=1 Tax=Streptomyces sp. ODS05-4 TaxID=2944939 RepID=UPI00210C8925|nr:DUF202 domain-containing protein [Streptomyces sp. ODS05-4]